jgi:hypothetical protein
MCEVQDAICAIYALAQQHGSHICSQPSSPLAAHIHKCHVPLPISSGSSHPGDAGHSGLAYVQHAGRRALTLAAAATLKALQGRSLVREAMASAAVALWVTCLVPSVPPQVAAARLASGLFLEPWQVQGGARVVPESGEGNEEVAAGEPSRASSELGALEAELAHLGTSLCEQVAQFSEVGGVERGICGVHSQT